MTNPHLIAADIAARVPLMAKDSATNNAEMIETMLRDETIRNRKVCCLYCGLEFGVDQKEIAVDHILSCEKSPLVQLVKSAEQLNTELADKLQLSESEVVERLEQIRDLQAELDRERQRADAAEAKCAELLQLCRAAYLSLSSHHQPHPTNSNGECKVCCSGAGCETFKQLHRIQFNLIEESNWVRREELDAAKAEVERLRGVLEFAAVAYNDEQAAASLASVLYDVSCMAKQALAAQKEDGK